MNDKPLYIAMKKREYLALIVFVSFLGCNVHNTNGDLKNKLAGTWTDELYELPEQNVVVVQEYIFMNDGNSSITTINYDSDLNFLGYAQYQEASYDVRDKKLTFSEILIYQPESGTLFQSVEELKSLKPIEFEKPANYDLEFFDNYKAVKLIFHCPFNAICAPYPELRKVED